ncbi:UNVERIFIED_CONTAM: Ubc4 [Trichonephila clavipes]
MAIKCQKFVKSAQAGILMTVLAAESHQGNPPKAAAMTLRTVLLSLQALLAAAEPDDPQDAVVAKQYKDDSEMFRLTARHWAQAYAGAPKSPSDFDDKIRRLVDMGVEELKTLCCC